MRLFLATLLLLLLIPVSITIADDTPPPTQINRIVGPESESESTDTPLGTEDNPYVYLVGDKGKLTLITKTKESKVLWNFTKSPQDTEILNPEPGTHVLWFPTNVPQKYQFVAAVHDPEAGLDILIPWIEIRNPNGPAPPTPDDDKATLTKRVLSGFSGQPKETLSADALKFQAAMTSLNSTLKTKPPQKLSELALILKTTLDTVQWQPNKYPDLSRLAGELAGGTLGGEGVADKTLDEEAIQKAINITDVVAKACATVVNNNGPKPLKK